MKGRVVRILCGVALATSTALIASACDSTDEASSPPTSPSVAPSTLADPTPAEVGIEPAGEPRAEPIDATMTAPDGRQRSYRIYVPASLPKRQPVPLLVALQRGTGSGLQYERNSGYDGLAEANQFIVVYPDGIEIGGATALARGRVWNGGRCCGPAAASQVDDVGFLSALIDQLAGQYRIDPARVYATGHSNGAIMSYRLACELSETIVAIGVQAGSVEVEACDPSRPVSVMHIHGTADENLPIEGGRGSKGISGVDFRPPRRGIGTFVRANACPQDSTTVISPENADVTIEGWRPCRAGSAVTFVAVRGASHAWMGHESTRVAQGLTGAPYPGYDSSAAIWAFLASHPR